MTAAEAAGSGEAVLQADGGSSRWQALIIQVPGIKQLWVLKVKSSYCVMSESVKIPKLFDLFNSHFIMLLFDTNEMQNSFGRYLEN